MCTGTLFQCLKPFPVASVFYDFTSPYLPFLIQSLIDTTLRELTVAYYVTMKVKLKDDEYELVIYTDGDSPYTDEGTVLAVKGHLSFCVWMPLHISEDQEEASANLAEGTAFLARQRYQFLELLEQERSICEEISQFLELNYLQTIFWLLYFFPQVKRFRLRMDGRDFLATYSMTERETQNKVTFTEIENYEELADLMLDCQQGLNITSFQLTTDEGKIYDLSVSGEVTVP